MSTVATTSFTLSRATVAMIVGGAASALVSDVDHQEMEFGRHWQWKHGEQVFTAEGLDLIGSKLREAGHTATANVLAGEVKRRQAPKELVRPWWRDEA